MEINKKKSGILDITNCIPATIDIHGYPVI
jgi:hypothetical protein